MWAKVHLFPHSLHGRWKMRKNIFKECSLLAAGLLVLSGFGACTFYDSSEPIEDAEIESSDSNKESSSSAENVSSSSSEAASSSSVSNVGKENFDADKMVFKDPRDKHEYAVVEIEGNLWFKENLAYKMTGALVYDDIDGKDNVDEFGYLYPQDKQSGACPEGSHVSSVEEWNSLITDSNNKNKDAKELLVGGKTGFEAKLGGMYDDGDFDGKNSFGYWYAVGESELSVVSVSNDSDAALMSNADDVQAYSIRCVVNMFTD